MMNTFLDGYDSLKLKKNEINNLNSNKIKAALMSLKSKKN